jgi:hypothetical protein
LDPKSQLIVRAAGICSVFLAVGGLLRLGGTGWWLIGALALLGLGMILAGLPEIFFGWNRFGRDRFDGGRRESRPFRAGATRKTMGMKRNGPGEIPGEIMAWLVGIAFLLTMGFGLLLVSQIQASQRQSDEMKKLDAAIAALHQQRPPGGAPGGSFVQLNPELEKAMLGYFNDSSTRANGASLFGAIPWITVLLVAIAAIVLALAAKEHPSAAPVLGVIPLAIAVIEHAEKLSRLDFGSFWVVLGIFGVIALVLIGLPFSRWGRDGGPADVSARGEKKKVDFLPVMGFSLLVLLFVLVYLGYRQQPEQKGSCPICIAPGPPPTPAMSKLQIDPIDHTPLFEPGLHEHFRGSAEQLKQILENTHEGDTLLLLGSADCTSYTGENAKLAQERANTIKKALESDADKRKVDIEARALKQHDSCKAADQLRAVFPVLIRPVSSGH